MGTVAQEFYHSTTDQDFTAPSEVDIRKLVDVNPATPNSTTITSHGTGTGGGVDRLADPYTTRSSSGGNAANIGWAINRAGADGMGSTSSRKRVIPAGTWVCQANVTLPVAGSVSGTIDAAGYWAIYRVSSTGTRTLIDSIGLSNTVQSTGLGSFTGNITASKALPEIVLEADETIHVGMGVVTAQMAGVLGATVPATVTFNLGTTASFVRVPAPGVRTRAIAALTGVVTSTAALARRPGKALAGTVAPAATVRRGVSRHLIGSVTPSGHAARTPRVHFTGTLAPTAAVLRIPIKALSSALTPGPSAVTGTAVKALGGTITPAGAAVRAVARAFTGSISTSGAVASTPGKSMGGSLAPGPATVTRTPVKVLGGEITPSATVQGLITKNLRSTVALAAALARRPARLLAGAVTLAGSVARRPAKFLTGVIGPDGGGGVTTVRKFWHLEG